MERIPGTAAVICEFNPFHYGHMRVLAEAKRRAGFVCGIMSGSLVQRGYPACADRYLRAAAAAECGYDAVFSLPFPYSCLSARDFASAGVKIARSIGMSVIVCGAEDPSSVRAAASILCDTGFAGRADELIRAEKRLSYPKAVARIIADAAGDKIAADMAKPNNILAAEYIRASAAVSGPPVEVVQRGAGEESAGSLRSRGAGMTEGIPEPARRFFFDTVPDSALDAYLFSALKTFSGDMTSLYGIDRTLAGRLARAATAAEKPEDMVPLCRSAAFTDARVRRALISLLFGITREQAAADPEYTLLLSARAASTPVIRNISGRSEIPVITRPSDAAGFPGFIREAKAESLLRTLYGSPDARSRTPYIQGADE